MKELKYLIVVVFFTLLTYVGVEPFAHSQMHPHVEDADYAFSDIKEKVGTGDATLGKESVTNNCTACHGLEKEGITAPMSDADASSTYGVVPPDLSTAGYLYDANFLAAFIQNPAKASKVSHKFGADKAHPMPNYDWMDKQEIANIVAYLKSIAPSTMEDKQVFENACGRCHSMKYDKVSARTDAVNINKYMGTTPPDLSMMIWSKGEEYLHKFINDPQKLLAGTAMPRVGLTEKTETQVINYLESVGDSKKEEREGLGKAFLIYLVILTVFAYLWKVQIWRKVH
jgi:ubiquinol-cytochrome c reductase cytochrome c1 subunit